MNQGATKKRAGQTVYKADYRDATPGQITLALLRYRPKASQPVQTRLPAQAQAEPAVKSGV